MSRKRIVTIVVIATSILVLTLLALMHSNTVFTTTSSINTGFSTVKIKQHNENLEYSIDKKINISTRYAVSGVKDTEDLNLIKTYEESKIKAKIVLNYLNNTTLILLSNTGTETVQISAIRVAEYGIGKVVYFKIFNRSIAVSPESRIVIKLRSIIIPLRPGSYVVQAVTNNNKTIPLTVIGVLS